MAINPKIPTFTSYKQASGFSLGKSASAVNLVRLLEPIWYVDTAEAVKAPYDKNAVHDADAAKDLEFFRRYA